MKVKDVMKPSRECVGPNDSVAMAEQVIKRTEPETVPVLDHAQPAGIVGERDLAEKVPEGIPKTSVQVRQVMKQLPAYAEPEEDLMQVEERMLAQGVASLPVFDQGKLVGVVQLTK